MKNRSNITKAKPWYFFAAILGGVFLSLLAGCAPQVLTPSPGDIQTALAQTLTAEPTPTLTPTIAPTRTPMASPTPFQTPTPTVSPPIAGVVTSDFLNMREGPSQMFQVVETYEKDTELTAVARTTDNFWVKVEVPNEADNIAPTVGWMWAEFLDLQGEVSGLPRDDFDPNLTVFGTVEDQDGNPIQGIGLTASLQGNPNALPADTISNEDGIFEFYLPEGTVGVVNVQITSWECDSVVVNLNCRLSGYVEGSDLASVTLPQMEGIVFVYEKTNLTLSGVVLDNSDDPAPGFNIVAVREDGAASYGTSDDEGAFSIPITAGNWEVYTITFDPEYTESDKVSVEVAETAPEDITLPIP